MNPNENMAENMPDNSDKKRDTRLFFIILLASLMLTLGFNLIQSIAKERESQELDYSEFIEMVKADIVTEVEFQSDKYVVTPDVNKLNSSNFKKLPLGATKFTTGFVNDDSLVSLLEEKSVRFSAPVTYNSPIFSFIISWVVPIAIMYLGLTLIMRFTMKRMGGFGGMTKSNAKVYLEKKTGVTFADVAGEDEAKESLVEIIDYLHNPEKYKKIGAKQPKGALLVGPPGTGKTLLAKAVAGEAGVTFMSLSGSDFEEMFVGVGASRVRELFKEANEHAPCIVFIDELDAVGQKRDNRLGVNDQTLNQLLSEMDGFDSSKGVVILAATNRPEVLDKALLRPGRFDRRVIVETPDLKGRVAILQVHAKDVIMDDNIDLEKIALATSGGTGADLANIINEAALRAVRFGREKVIQEDLMESVEVVIAGKEKKDRIMSEKEKRIVATHEVGHALAAALQKNAQPVQKITIIPRTMGSLGYTLTMPEEETYLKSKDEILAEIVCLLAGRSAEEVEFDSVTTGASNDIERASAMARNMISIYGMSDTFDMMALESIENKYLDATKSYNVGETTIAKLDEEVLKIIREAHQKAKDILTEHKDALEAISEFLYKEETITGEQFMEILSEYTQVGNKEEDTEKKEPIEEENKIEENE